MKKSMLFSAIADFYEYSMNTNCDYDKWAQYVLTRLGEFFSPDRKSVCGIDAACGSGYFTRALKRAGYDVSGCDISAEMLTCAQKKCAEEKLNVNFSLQDISCLKSFKKVDFITVINDGINFVPQNKLQKTFNGFYKILNKGGVVHFDVSTEYKLRNVLANETFCEDDDDYSYIWFNKLFEDRVQMDMSVFVRKNDLFEKRESSLCEYIHTKDSLFNALSSAGFVVLHADGEFGSRYFEKSERLCITAVKK